MTTEPAVPRESGAYRQPAWRMVDRVTGTVAILGGALSLAMALLVVVSVLGRWLFAKPIEGDFEFIKMATAVAVFASLPYTQARRGNIMVDTFTGRLPPSVQRGLDVAWDLVYAAMMGLVAYCMFNGTRDYIRSGETTMMWQIVLWPTIGLGMLLTILLALTSLATALRLYRHLP